MQTKRQIFGRDGDVHSTTEGTGPHGTHGPPASRQQRTMYTPLTRRGALSPFIAEKVHENGPEQRFSKDTQSFSSDAFTIPSDRANTRLIMGTAYSYM